MSKKVIQTSKQELKTVTAKTLIKAKRIIFIELVSPVEIESSRKLNIWASTSMAGEVGIYIIEGNFNAILYEDILREVPSARELYPEGVICKEIIVKFIGQ